MSSLKLALKLTADLESKLYITIDIKYFRAASFIKKTAWHEQFTSVIQLPNTKGLEFREFLYHELGHALLSTYEIPKYMLQPFTKRDPSFLKYAYGAIYGKWADRKLGFISGYATISTAEDFCETFSSWITNDFRTSGAFLYDGETINASKDLKLRRKLQAVKTIVTRCRQIEKSLVDAA